jgi:hypothetical protein
LSLTKEEARQIYQEHSPYVFRVALFITKSEASAEDIVQDTFMQIFKKYDTFDKSKSLTAFYCYKLIWGNTNITISTENSDFTNYVTPLELFEKILQTTGTKTFNLIDSRKKSDFPIRQPDEIKSWTKIKSQGVVQPVFTSNAGGLIKSADEPLYYLDLYVNNSSDQRIVVEQRYDQMMSDALKRKKGNEYLRGYPKGSKILTNFGADFAVLMDLQKGRYELQIIHNEENNNATKIDIWGNTNPEILENFARKYLSAPLQ